MQQAITRVHCKHYRLKHVPEQKERINRHSCIENSLKRETLCDVKQVSSITFTQTSIHLCHTYTPHHLYLIGQQGFLNWALCSTPVSVFKMQNLVFEFVAVKT